MVFVTYQAGSPYVAQVTVEIGAGRNVQADANGVPLGDCSNQDEASTQDYHFF